MRRLPTSYNVGVIINSVNMRDLAGRKHAFHGQRVSSAECRVRSMPPGRDTATVGVSAAICIELRTMRPGGTSAAPRRATIRVRSICNSIAHARGRGGRRPMCELARARRVLDVPRPARHDRELSTREVVAERSPCLQRTMF